MKTNISWRIIFFLSILAISFGISSFLINEKPQLISISSQELKAGDQVTLIGKHLGNMKDYVLVVGGHTVLPRFIRQWTSNQIVFTLSEDMRAGPVFVRSRNFQSNSLFFLNQSQVPSVVVQKGTSSYLISLSEEIWHPTEEIILKGRFFNQLAEDRSLILEFFEGFGKKTYKFSSDEIIYWRDNEICFSVPLNIYSGIIYIKEKKKRTNFLNYKMDERSSRWEVGKVYHHNFNQTIELKVISVSKNSKYFYFWFPYFEQAQKIEDNENNFQGIFEEVFSLGSWRVYKVKVLPNQNNQKILFSRGFLVNSFDTTIVINPDFFLPYRKNQDLFQSYTQTKDFFKLNENLKALVNVNKFRSLTNSYEKSFQVFNTFIKNFKTTESFVNWAEVKREEPTLSPSQLNYFFIMFLRSLGIPTRERLGYLFSPIEGTYKNWQWAELYLEGIGWVPVDISLSVEKKESFWLRKTQNHIPLHPFFEIWPSLSIEGQLLEVKNREGNPYIQGFSHWMYESIGSEVNVEVIRNHFEIIKESR